ncbi:ubiquinone/menaquinone biosynthesis C-methylase UbiE [Anaerosolibacter carboniphilus]|uniref:Ubiquinone/menaquinone biosynthesis C-methylase UbiE n=1 Tax=Anaerosolibacter carboniphilus TaxID=1417629 RepID=A0A841KXP8_9FIRM|nr:methyltransferase domain-containing protein [Anaerosolibacter carboniphilus]MBB6218127.1 ubiquinone/menaquinone biosynthesis C-methylase UbiE [Anaerosolibacter carboniphilus]
MCDNRVVKFENPVRISELNPRTTLIRVGFEEGMKLCDIGAGTGIFSFPATEISNDDVYALEISDKMIEVLSSRMAERNIKNLKVKKVDSDILPVESNICDMAIMVTVLHEIKNKDFMLNEIIRILKTKGKLMIIEFHKRKTPMGPPMEHRISEEYVEEICSNNGLKMISKFSLGDNFYTVVFES